MDLVGQIYQKNELKILPDFFDSFQQLSQNTKMLLLFFKISNLLYSQVHLNLHPCG
jgi:hypothetical protein